MSAVMEDTAYDDFFADYDPGISFIKLLDLIAAQPTEVSAKLREVFVAIVYEKEEDEALSLKRFEYEELLSRLRQLSN